ncbi:MAG: immunoglobulin domain-containing protein, partial [candidate division Zixibacteria bacterium]|nr:immunoglobulin domain-containing protein [candidate division Zixibacteria bacterium]
MLITLRMGMRTAAMLSVMLLVLLGMTSSALAAPPAANLDQVRNGPPDAPVDPGDWVNGNVGGQQGHYVEGYSVPYRAVLTNLPIGEPIWLTLGYDIKHSDRDAVDYLTFYDRIDYPLHDDVFGHGPEVIDPTIDVTGVSGPATGTFTIPEPSSAGSPAPGQPGISYNNLTAGELLMSIWNGAISDIQYGYYVDDVFVPNGQGDLNASQAETQITVYFTASSETVVLSWGGHIGSRVDWGFDADGVPYSAGGISGSPYHMRLKDWNLNNLGNQDRSLSAVAVYIPPPECEITPVSDAICVGASASFTVIASSGTEPYTYSWTGPSGFVSTDATINIVNAQSVDAGTYTCVVTDADDKTTECSAELTVWDQPICDITGG